jgi:hypothetical protein
MKQFAEELVVGAENTPRALKSRNHIFNDLTARLNSLRENATRRGRTTTRAKAHTDFTSLRGPEGPLLHSDAHIIEFFRSL